MLAAVLPDAAVPGGRIDPRGGAALGEAVLRLLAALAGRSRGTGTLLVLEDLHWVDPDTLTVLTYLAHAAESSPLLLVATCRAERRAARSRCWSSSQATQATELPLERLDADDVRDLIEACLPDRPPEEVVAFVRDNADGLPLLIEELLTGLGSVGALNPAGRLVGPLTPAVPRTFAATVRRRVEDLDPAARSVVRAAAVLGRRFDWSLLPEITGLPEIEVLAALRAAVKSGLVRAGEGDTFDFRHALTGEAIRDDLLPPERRALAHAAAEIVERRDPEAYALAAGLRAAAGEDERAAELSVAAGRVAARQGALASADLLLSRAADLATAPELRTGAERELLGVLAGKGDAERALALGERLLRGGDESVRLVLAGVAADAERWDVAAAYLSAVPDDGDPQLGVLGARLAYARGEPDRARQMAEAALRSARDRELWPVACQALEVIGRVARHRRRGRGPGRLRRRRGAGPRARPAAEPGLRAARARHRRPAPGRLHRPAGAGPGGWPRRPACSARPPPSTCRSRPGCCTAEPARGLEYARRCADMARRLRADRLYATAVCFQAIAHAELGDREQAERCAAQSLALAPDDLDINASIWGQVRAHEALLADDQARLLETLDMAADYLRRSPSTAADPDQGSVGAGPHACPPRTATPPGPRPAPSSVNWENASLLGYAEAVDCGRRGRRREADRALAAADRAMAALPWWQHRIRLLVADVRAHRRLGRPDRLGPGGAAGLRRPRRDPAGQPLPGGAAPGRCAGAPPGPRRHAGAAGAARGRGDQPRGRRAAADGRGADQHRDRAAAGALAAHDRDARREPGRQDRRAQPGRAGRVGPGPD